METIKVIDIDHLNKLIESGICDFVVCGGFCKSSKAIQFGDEDNTYCVYNEIDDSEDNFTLEELLESNVGIALKNGSLYAYKW